MRLDGHDGKVLDAGDVGEGKRVPEDDVGVGDVVPARDEGVDAARAAVGLVGELAGAVQLAVPVARHPDVVLREGRPPRNVRVRHREAQLARVRHQLVRDGRHGDGVNHVWVVLRESALAET